MQSSVSKLFGLLIVIAVMPSVAFITEGVSSGLLGSSVQSLLVVKNIGIIVRVPLDEGGLTGKITSETTFPVGDFRNRYFRDDRKQQIVDHIDKLKNFLGKEASTIPELALRFCLHHPAVSTVIPGMRSITNVEMNCSFSDAMKLSQDILAELRKHTWNRNFYR